MSGAAGNENTARWQTEAGQSAPAEPSTLDCQISDSEGHDDQADSAGAGARAGRHRPVSGSTSMTRIRPGDVVLLPVVMGMTHKEISELRAELVAAFPGVMWSIQRETMITEPLVYRTGESTDG